MFRAAFMSRSCTAPHEAHSHSRTCKGFGPWQTPHAEHTWEVGSDRLVRWNWRPYSRALCSPGGIKARLTSSRLAAFTPGLKAGALPASLVASRRGTRAVSSAGERFPDTEEVTGSNPVRPTPFFENLSNGESHDESQRPAGSSLNSWSERSMSRATHRFPGRFGALSRRSRRARAQLTSPISKVIAGPKGGAVRYWSRGSKAARSLPALPHRHQLVSAQHRPDPQLRTHARPDNERY